jgi:hypothetical protein
MAGRKPLGPALVEHLEGSEDAKERLEVILATIARQLPITVACQQLGISEAMFHKLRWRVLRACVGELEPKPRGRRPRQLSPEASQVASLSQQVDSLRSELAASQVRLELAQVLPQVVQADPPLKKTTAVERRKWTRRRRRRRRLPK